MKAHNIVRLPTTVNTSARSIETDKPRSRQSAFLQTLVVLLSPMFVLAAFIGAALAQPAQRSASPLFVPSPNGRYVAGSFMASADAGTDYDLFVRDRATGTHRILERFSRAADLLWSPDSAHLAVTFWGSSSDASIVVYSMNPLVGARHLGSAASASNLAPYLDRLPEARKNDHVYFQALSWQGAATLRVRIFGHGDNDPKGFAKCFDVSLRAGAMLRGTRCPPIRGVDG